MDSTSAKRLTDNEATSRSANESAKRALQVTMADDEPIYFSCECSNADCRERIMLSSRQFAELHHNRRYFIVKPGHETADVERVISRSPDYVTVEKFSGTA